MNIGLPSSRAGFRARLSPTDAALAAAAPLAALYLLGVDAASGERMMIAGDYFLVSVLSSLIAFQVFRIGAGIPCYMSAADVAAAAKAVLCGQLLTAAVLLTAMSDSGIPRSVPAVQGLILAAGLAASKGLAVFAERRRRAAQRPRRRPAAEHIILIGLNDLSALVLEYLRALGSDRGRVIALLDEDPRWFGRRVERVPVLGPPAQLEALVEEFAGHGVRTDRVIVGGEAGLLSAAALAEVRAVCARCGIRLAFASDLFEPGVVVGAAGPDAARGRNSRPLPEMPQSAYSRLKRLIDVAGALALILWLLPLLLLAGAVVLLDVGWPVLFWQLRAGQGGRELQIYKFRTLRAPFDRKGRRIQEERRISWVGRLLRRTRIDELPQLANVLVGDMSLIGPRPLLARDQPPNSTVRLMVRPGITGWAQVNGGTLLSPTEKEALDIWYIRNASLWVDLRIIAMTARILLRGERRSERALAEAQCLPVEPPEWGARGPSHPASSRLAVAVAGPRRDAGRAAAMRSR